MLSYAILKSVHFNMINLLKAVDGSIPNFAGIKYTHEDFMDFQVKVEREVFYNETLSRVQYSDFMTHAGEMCESLIWFKKLGPDVNNSSSNIFDHYTVEEI